MKDSSTEQYELIKYRGDIDGLRAIAVIAVVLYHAFPKFIKGGFVGVDIFFTLSGYLIGSILFKNFDSKKFCIYTFYARRIKRIFPALLLVLFFSLVVGWFSLTDVEYIALSIHARASTFFYTNFALAKEGGYFDTIVHTKPLMHLWSLALEEQFYIFCPLFLYFFTKKNFNIISICIIFILSSFVFSIKTLHTYPVHAFYYPLSRSWELISGVLLSYIIYNKIEFPKKIAEIINYYLSLIVYKSRYFYSPNISLDILSLIGLIINICSIFFLKKTDSFPGYWAMLPVVGTLFILAAGEKAWINKIILSNKVFVSIGLISYPLYLWHWSLLSFVFIFEGPEPRKEIILTVLLVSSILACGTYRFIEKPIRKAKDSRIIPFVLVIVMILIGGAAHTIISNKGYIDRNVNMLDSIPFLPQNDQRLLNLAVSCNSPLDKSLESTYVDPFCLVNSDKPQVLVVGDSHALSFSYSAAIRNSLNIALITLSSQPPYRSYVAYVKSPNNKEERTKYLKLLNMYLDAMLESYSSIEYVVLISRGPAYFSSEGFGIETKTFNFGDVMLESIDNNQSSFSKKEAFLKGYIETIKFLLSKGKKVIFAIDFPELGEDPLLCIKRSFSLTGSKSKCILERYIVDVRQKEYRELVKQLKQQIPELLLYDPTSAFCDHDKCYGKKNNIIYGDSHHLNIEGSKLLMDDFKRFLDSFQSVNGSRS